jgi:hypothetical protein
MAQINGIKLNEAPKSKNNDQETLSNLWQKHYDHEFNSHTTSGKLSDEAKKNASKIETHVRNHYGSEVADDMKNHSRHKLTIANYTSLSGIDDKAIVAGKKAAKLRQKHNLDL